MPPVKSGYHTKSTRKASLYLATLFSSMRIWEKNNLKNLVRNSVEETLDALPDHEAGIRCKDQSILFINANTRISKKNFPSAFQPCHIQPDNHAAKYLWSGYWSFCSHQASIRSWWTTSLFWTSCCVALWNVNIPRLDSSFPMWWWQNNRTIPFYFEVDKKEAQLQSDPGCSNHRPHWTAGIVSQLM